MFAFFPFLSEQTMRMRRLLAYAETLTGLNSPMSPSGRILYAATRAREESFNFLGSGSQASTGALRPSSHYAEEI